MITSCPICGAKIPDGRSAKDFICAFCHFECRPKIGTCVKAISSVEDTSLPFQEDLNRYFYDKFQKLEPGDLWHLSTPVKRSFRREIALPGQINFFRGKNIMFLLEQNSFKMVWRKNRFSPILRIIARRC